MGVKLYQGLKQDRVSDSLGSSADGTNTGITLVNDYPIFGTSSNGAISTTNYTNDSYTKTSSNNNWDGQAWGSVATKEIIVEIPDATSSSSDTMVGLSTSSSSDTFGKAMIYIKSDDNLDIKLNGNNSPSGGTHSGISIGSNTFFKITDDGSKIKYYQGTSRTSMNLIYTVPDDGGTYIDTTGYPYILQNQQDVRKAILHQNTEAYNPAKLGTGAYDFDGSGDYVEVNGLKTVFNGATKLSVAGWIYPRDNVDETLLGQWNGSGNSDKIMDLHINGSNKLELSLRTGGTNYITTSSTSINENEWQHVAMTYDGATTTVKLYINGTLDVTDTSNPSSLQTGTGSPALFGIYGDKSSNPFDGILDDWGVWSRVLTATEIEKLVNNNDPAISFSNYTGASSVDLSATTSSRLGTLIGDSGKFDTVKVELRVIGSHTSSNVVKLIVVKKSDNSVLATSNTKTIADLTGGSTKTEYTFTFASSVTVTAGDYYLFCEYPYGDASDYLGLGRSASGVTNWSWVYNSASGSSYTENTGQSMKAVISGTGGSAQLVSSLSNKSELKAYYSMDTETTGQSSSTSSHSGGTAGSDDVSGIDAAMANPRGGWGQQIKTGHPLVGKLLKTLTVSTRLSSNIGGRSDKDMTVKVFAGTDTTTTRGTSQAISTSTLTTAGTWYDKTFTFTNAVELSADDCICVCIDGDVGTSGGWNAEIKDTPEDTNKGYWVTFQDATNPVSGSIQTNRSLIYTATYYTMVDKCPNNYSSTAPISSLSGVRTNSIFEQTDSTPSYWWYDGTSWVLDGTTEKQFDFSSATGWTQSSGNFTIDTANSEMDFSVESGTNGAKAYYDLTSISDTKWVLRIEDLNFSTINTYGAMCIGVSSITAIERANASSSIASRIADYGDGADYIVVSSYNGDTTRVDGSVGRPTLSTGTNYSVELSRNGSTVTTKMFTGGFGGTLVGESTDTISGTTGQRYLFISQSYNTGAGNTNTNFVGTIQGMKFQNGVSEWLE